MAERDGYIPGVPCWVDTGQPDPEAAVAFYRGLFGWEFEDTMPPGSPGRYYIARLRGGDVAAVGSLPEGAPAVPAWNTYIWVASADETAAKVREAGGEVLAEPFDVLDAGRMATLADPEGAVFGVWQPGGMKGAQIVNEPGSVNFNGLHTRDVAGAKRFYGSVFGWGTITVSGAELWTLPGYGDHLEERDPGLRARLVEFGAEPGFEDVVASINPIGDDEAGVPAHWSVTFSTDDADELAARATEMGGTVLVPPTDVPWSRMTVLADPQGASFIATKFVPEDPDRGDAEQTGV
jgi:predicted enzyme related to lactoylglutathione lyase